jgi:decaprenyl-phosphate phosphoribosyltransferase
MYSRMIRDLVKLARPKQWVKAAFVLVGPLYALAGGSPIDWVGVALTTAAFCVAASGCYILNDLKDRELDKSHPRKKNRPIASGRVSTSTAWTFALALFVLSAAFLGAWVFIDTQHRTGQHWLWPLVLLAIYVVNVNAYSYSLKNHVVTDVMSLSLGFVVRVLAGCAAGGIEASPWLVNATFFISMFLAFSKRLGERRTMGGGEEAAAARRVQLQYTDAILRMLVVVTAVATLLTYADYVRSHELAPRVGSAASSVASAASASSFNLLWLTMLPATYGLLRAIVLVERGDYDDPTELASNDRPFQIAVVAFGVLTALAWYAARGAPLLPPPT